MVLHTKINHIKNTLVKFGAAKLWLNFRFLLLSIVLLFCFSLQAIQVEAKYTFVPKSKLVYEITSVNLLDSGYLIKGWAFINESQHYLNIGDSDGKLVLRSNQGNIDVPLTFEHSDMTYLMKMDNRRRCSDLEFNKTANECYYEYKNVNFSALIPFDDLTDNTSYTIQLQLHAEKTDKKYAIDVYFVSTTDLMAKHKDRVISLKATIDQTYFYVNHNFVLARKEASKASPVHQAANSCSTTYGSDHYFEPDSQYFQIKEVRLVNLVSWYQIRTKHKYCSPEGLHYVEEGGSNVTWLPSSFIEYNGNPATIEVKKENTPPVIVVTNPTIYVGDTSFRSEDFVDAYDLEDGILIPIKGIGNLNINKVGTYIQEYSAIDSHGLLTSKIMLIKVIAKPANTPPIITAKNHTIYQYSSFDELIGVSAFDLEDGDISSAVIPLNVINSSILGKQDLCLYVVDSGGLNHTKCVVVTVIPYPKFSVSTTLRFIDAKKLFYKEMIPVLWQGRDANIRLALDQVTPLRKITLQ